MVRLRFIFEGSLFTFIFELSQKNHIANLEAFVDSLIILYSMSVFVGQNS